MFVENVNVCTSVSLRCEAYGQCLYALEFSVTDVLTV